MERCIFCKIISGELLSYKIYEDTFTVAFLDIAGDVDGHMLVAPKTHVESILDCDIETFHQLMSAVKKVSEHLVNHCGYEGVNLLNASGVSAGQSVGHFHIHIIPRKTGDNVDAWPAFAGGTTLLEDMCDQLKFPE